MSCFSLLRGQSLDDPRSIGLAAYGPFVRDLRGFGANPAGLAWMRDWELVTTTYSSVGDGNAGFVFQGFALGKRFTERDAAAFAYTPGSSLRFYVPPSLFIAEGNTPASNDQELEYDEPMIAGYAHRFTNNFSAGIGVHLGRDHVTTTIYEIAQQDTIAYPVSSKREFTASYWGVDAALAWNPIEPLSVSLTLRNLARPGEKHLPEEVAEFEIPRKTVLTGGLSFRAAPFLTAAASFATDKYGAAGYELQLPLSLSFRNGFFLHAGQRRFVEGYSIGIGWSMDVLSVDASYVGFVANQNNGGIASLSGFHASDITRLDLNPFIADRVSLSLRAIFGNVRESLVRLDGVEMLGGIYPSAADAFAFRPVGKARVTNISTKPIQVRIGFLVEHYMDEPTETPAVYVAPGASAEIPFQAIFNDRLRSVPRLQVFDGQVYATATPAERHDDITSTRVLIYGKNDWNGDVQTLRYFVTPENPEVLKYTRDVLLQARTALDTVPRGLDAFMKAQLLMNTFAGKLVYVSDPHQSADYVQYPAETLSLHGGDCDDMSVLFSSLLGSVGISTAFVDVLPPGKPEDGHIYLLFDTGLSPKYGMSIAANPKRFVVRRNKGGEETVWIPVEPTVITRGFDEAWSKGAQEFFDDVEVGLGVVKGWVRVVDVN
jgi:hypothetical protein